MHPRILQTIRENSDEFIALFIDQLDIGQKTINYWSEQTGIGYISLRKIVEGRTKKLRYATMEKVHTFLCKVLTREQMGKFAIEQKNNL